MFDYFNPILKIIFILLQLIFLFLIQKTILQISVFFLLLIFILSSPGIIKQIILTILRISPLLLSIFLIGYIFGNTWQNDVFIILSILMMVSYTVLVMKTTSAYSFLSQLRRLCPAKSRGNIIIFLYGVIRFLPMIFYEYSHTLHLYKYHTGSKMGFPDVLDIFPLVVQKSLIKVNRYSSTSRTLIDGLISRSFHTTDLLLPLLVIIQIVLLFI